MIGAGQNVVDDVASGGLLAAPPAPPPCKILIGRRAS